MAVSDPLNKNVITNIEQTRTSICNYFLVSLTCISIPALIVSLNRMSLIGWKPVMTIHIIVVVFLLVFSLFRHKIQYIYKASLIVFLFLLLGLSGIFQFGLIAGGVIALVVTAPVATLFFEGKVGAIVLLTILLSEAILGYGFVFDYISLDFDLLTYANDPSAWTTNIVSLILCGGSLTVAMEVFNSQLILALQKSEQYKDNFKKNQKVLENTIDQLRVSEEQLTNVINSAHLGYWDWDYKSGEHIINERWLMMLGLTQSDLHNEISDWNNRIHPDDKQHVVETIQAHIKSGDRYVIEFRMKHIDGHWVWIQGSGAVVEYNKETGEPSRLCGTHQDITERKKVDFELNQYKNNLEKIVIERTTDLEHARKEAENANQAKSAFLSSMSHELRTPLNAVIGFSQLLVLDDKDPLTANQLESVEQISEGGVLLLNLINEILDLSKIESRSIDIKTESIDTNSLVKQVYSLIKPQADQQAITLCNKVTDEEPLLVKADFNRLKQILLNFSSNAVKYNSEKGIVTFSCNRTNEGKIRLSVSDSGKGVPEALFPSLFEPFNRLDKDSSTIQGTGIGLSISKQLAELMGGEIGVYQNPDKGLTFWVEFVQA